MITDCHLKHIYQIRICTDSNQIELNSNSYIGVAYSIVYIELSLFSYPHLILQLHPSYIKYITMSHPVSSQHFHKPKLEELSTPIKLISTAKNGPTYNKPPLRAQLFAKQRYLTKKANGQMASPKRQLPKQPFKPYDLSKSPPKPLKLRVIQNSQKTLDQLLIQKQINLKQLLTQNDYLPLECFCSSDYDFQSTEGWLQRLKEHKTMTALYYNQESLRFQDVVLIDDQMKKQYESQKTQQVNNNTVSKAGKEQPAEVMKGFWVKDEKTEYKRLSRWQIWFPGQDVQKWLQKIIKASQIRKQMDSLLRFNYYVDNMPVDDVNHLQTHLQTGVLGRIALTFQKQQIDPLMQEMNHAFVKLQNQVLFKKHLRQNSDAQKMFSKPLKLDFTKTKIIPELGRVGLKRDKQVVVLNIGKIQKIQAKTFNQKFKAFGLASLTSNKHILGALDQIKKECLQLKVVDLFDTNFVTGLTNLSDFKYAQEHYIHKGMRKVVDIFPNKIHEIIKRNLKLNKDNQCTIIEQSQFRRFLQLTQHYMKEALNECIKYNYHSLYRMFVSYVPDQIVVQHAGFVKNVYAKDKGAESLYSIQNLSKREVPFFCIMLKINQTQDDFTFTLSPKEFKDLFYSYFTKVLEDLDNISDLQSRYLPRYENYQIVKYKIKITKLPTQKPTALHIRPGVQIQDQNFWIWQLFDSFKQNIDKVVHPLAEYLSKYNVYKQFLLMDINKYLDNVEKDETKQIKQIREYITVNFSRQGQIKKQIIEKIQVGIFQIQTKQISDFLQNKYRAIAQGLIRVIANRVIRSTQEQLQQFRQIQQKIKKMTKNIEQASELKDYLEGQVATQIQKMRVQIKKNGQIYQLMDQYQYKFQPSQIDSRWTVYKKPKDIHDTVEQRLEHLTNESKKYEQQMFQEQDDYRKKFEATEKVIRTFHTNNVITNHETVMKSCAEIMQTLGGLLQQSRKFNSRQILFGHEQTEYSRLQQVTKQFTPYNTLWSIVNRWYTDIKIWMDNPFQSIDANAAEKFVEESFRNIVTANRYFKQKAMAQIVNIGEKVKTEMDAFRPNLPLMVSLRKDGMKERHWNQVSKLINKQIDPNAQNFTFKSILDLKLLNHVEACVQIGQKASKQYNIQTMLSEMWGIWQKIQFDLAPYKGNTFIIRGYDDIQATLDEHLVNTQVIQFSAFKKPFEDQIVSWYGKLKMVSDVMEEWMKCQANWMYLQPIFDSGDISKQLPAQSKKFRSVDNVWKTNINLAKQYLKVMDVCCAQGLLQKFRDANQKLQNIQKSLNQYLQKKRQKFARFYFLSNDDLLEILSQTKQPTAVQPHLKKVFENINAIEFDYKKNIVAMFSAQKQKVDFVEHVNPNQKNVEDWMNEVQQMMKLSVRHQLQRCVAIYPKTKRTQWTCSHPGQCVLNGSQVWWTTLVQQAINSKKVKQYYQLSTSQLNDLVELVRKPLTKQQKVTINALIVIDVHAKDVVEKLVKEQIQDVSSFEWISQLRYYWTDNDCYVRCIQTNFPYGYEYLGNTLRLVITPLTDKCYMTLMGALKLNLGGAPAGPAGTGKTQSTKDLAKALAKQCVVFNCSDSMDYIMIGKFFKGLASAGAWCCFDEFNRINIEVLSVIAQQLLILFGQKAKGSSQCDFEGSHIRILPTFSVFITMNPGYAGRTQLPDNLKALFRAVAMMVPDYALIGQIMLYSFGFNKGRQLAKKMVVTFKLSSQQLSSQDHYDYGMRAVRSVINAAGLLKAASPDMDQDQLLLRALRDVNVPKFLQDDLPLFENIIKDLFPGVDQPKIDYGQLLETVKAKAQQFNLIPKKQFIDKVQQLYDTIQVRHGLMLVGPTGGGKTQTYKVLSAAMTSLANKGQAKVHNHILNPKSIKMGQLYGQFNQQTHEWADGILAYMVRECVRDQSTEKHWIIFDGPVDSLWIQSMNTVLDDNKKLCLNSGQILTLTPQMTMMFEVQDLAVASPATVSRCGMVYMEPQSIGIHPLIQSWTKVLPQQMRKRTKLMTTLKNLFNNFVQPCLEFLRVNCKELVTTSNGNLVQSLMRVLDCFLETYKQNQVKKVNNQQFENLEANIDKIFHFALTWSIGCTTNLQGRQKFDVFLKDLDTVKKLKIYPSSGTIYDYEFKDKQNQWVNWTAAIQYFEIDQKLSYHQIAIPTKDSIRNRHLIKILLQQNHHVLTLGPTGTGKSLNNSQLLTTGLSDTYQYIGLTFSAQTGANQTQDTIDSKMQKRRKGYYGPPIGKKCIVFIDDLNMPKKQTYGAQPPIELVRQYLDHSGWYDRKTLQFMKLQDLLMLCTMGPPGGGRTFITNRLARHFNILAYTQLPNDIINAIFSSLLGFYFRKFPEPVRNLARPVSEYCLKIFQFVKAQLLPTPSKSHYTFNLRDIWKVVQGMCSANPKSISSIKSLIHLWYHENMRVYHDRLISKEDKDVFIAQTVRLGNQFNNFVPAEENNEQGDEAQKKQHKGPYRMQAKRVMFTDFMAGRQGQNRAYCQAQDLHKLVQKIEQYLEEYNIEMGSKKAMKLVMFLDACEHISRICRIIRQPQGNALLLGVGGSGRQSLSKVATYIMNYSLRQIQVIKNYSMKNWRQDIKDILLSAGVHNKPISFLFVDTQIINQQMLEDINGVLNSGDVANMYNQKDMEDIINSCKGDCAKKNLQPNKMNIFAMYLARVKRNIHIVMCMSPIGEAFTTRLRMFPSLINGSTIDWFSEWPQEALLGVGKGQLAEVEIQLGLQGQLDVFVEVFKTIHKSVEKQSISFKAELSRINHVTPTIYLQLLDTYKRVLREKRKQSSFSISRLQNGLDKLFQANNAVEEMQVQLTKMQPQLQKASIQTEKLMQKLTVDKANAEEVQIVVSAQQKIANQQKAQASKLAAEAQASVSQANASLQVTLAQVKKLKKDHLNEIKALANPPNVIKVVLGGIVILLQHKIKEVGGQIVIKTIDGKKEEDYFQTAKKYLLSDVTTLMKSLLQYQKQSINPAFVKKLQDKILGDPQFTLERAKTGSYAIQFLYLWVKAMYDFNKVFNQTRPLREKLEGTQKLLAQKTAFLKEKMDALDAVNRQIKTLEDTFEQKMNEKERLTNEIQMCRVKLERAKKLISGLSDQQVRWSKDVKIYQQDSLKIAGDCAVSAGMIAYAGPFTAEYRHRMQKTWEAKLKSLNIQHTKEVTMRGFVGVAVTIQGWNIAGLPKDDTSTQNGIIIDKTKRWPLMIDPQNQANKFIKNLGSKHEQGINVVKTTQANLMRTIQLAIQFGKWVLLQGIGKDLDPSLEPILLQKVVKTGSSYQITIGQKTINYSQAFKFYMTTTVPNPHYPPQIFVKVSVINFAITPSGLQEQMLAQIVALQNPQMQQKKLDIVMKNAQDKKTLIQIQDSILKALSSTGGNIDQFLKDQSLINQLSNSKKTSQEINKRVEQSKITERQIDQTRQGYRPVAFRASLLFFCILDFALIDPMYQYSLQWFSRLFVMSVEASAPSNVLEQRLENMNSYFTYSLYENVCRSLFEKHKLLFSFVLTIKIKQGYRKIDLKEWRYLLSGPAGQIVIPQNPTTWIPENQWPDFYRQFYGAGQIDAMKGIQDHLINHSDQWKVLFDSPCPQDEKLPEPFQSKLDTFQKIIVIKSIRADKVIPAIQNYVSLTMGEKFIVAPTFDLSKCYRDSSVVTPLIFVLSSGSDPVADFLKFADQANMSERYKSISLGQGQGKKAKALVQLSTAKGYWVLLQNCHLSISWMPELELIVEGLNEGMHKDFRLWLTSMPTQSFSIPILQNSIKMTLQPPSGLRNNLLRTYKNMDERQVGQCKKPEQYKKLLFGFCLFHAIVQDRRKFGAIGWNIAYQFTNEDLTVCRKQLKMLLDEYNVIPYKVLNFLGSQINYGGRVTDDKDVRLITTIIKVYITEGALHEGFAFSRSGTYKQPLASTFDQYIEYIEKLPLNPAPQAFGLHDNAQITNSQNQTLQMLQSILSVQPRTGTGSGKSRQEVIQEIASFVQSKTPQVFPMYQIQKRYPTSYEQSMNTVLVQQVLRYNKLLQVMKQNLVNVKKALKGQIVMSEQLQLIANSLFDNQVPKLWDEKGFLSMKPLASWTEDLNHRITFLQKWIDEGTPKCFWISGFFFPQAFLTGTLQNYARKHIIAIDKLSFQFKYLQEQASDVTEKPADGCLVHGLFLEGARWSRSRKQIVDPMPKQLYSSLPMLLLLPQVDRQTPEVGIYNCPVYKVVSRRGTLSTTGHSTNFVMFFEMPTKEIQDTWVRAGVAAFLALRY